MNKSRQSGFTLIELMITMGVLALLMTIAYPSFQGQMRKGRRSQGIATLQDMQLTQERWRTNNTTYGSMSDLNFAASDEYYDYSIGSVSTTTYTLKAVAKGSQADDGTCGAMAGMTITESNTKSPPECF